MAKVGIRCQKCDGQLRAKHNIKSSKDIFKSAERYVCIKCGQQYELDNPEVMPKIKNMEYTMIFAVFIGLILMLLSRFAFAGNMLMQTIMLGATVLIVLFVFIYATKVMMPFTSEHLVPVDDEDTSEHESN